MASSAPRPGFLQATAFAVASRFLARRRSAAAPISYVPRTQSHSAADSSEGDAKPDPRAEKESGGSPSDAGRGRSADHPGEIPARGWKDIAWRVYEQIGKDRVLAVAAGVTFYGLLSVFPMIAALVSIYGLFADATSISEHLNVISGFLPGGAVEIIGEQVKRIASQPGGTLGLSLFISLGLSLWSANAGMKAIFDALNVAYGEDEKRSFISLNAQTLLFTLGGVVGLLVAMLGVVAIPVALAYLGLGGALEWTLRLARWPLLLAVIVFGLALLYRYGPSRDRAKWRWLTPGAMLAAILWLVASMLFSWYASNFGSYNKTYGSLGAAVGFMTWIWISVTIILIGAEVNAETEHQTARDSTEGPAQPMGVRGAAMADNVGAAQT
ncbi:MAG: hypothetical protein JWN93_2894 [Hyphomicrobiales bacterium]|nr:hypothetical protein [Hyphomicrobiales bacterium]